MNLPRVGGSPAPSVAEDNAGSKARPTVFARVAWRGTRMTPSFDRSVVVDELLEQVQQKFGFGSPFGGAGERAF